jgi:hypothetical protein
MRVTQARRPSIKIRTSEIGLDRYVISHYQMPTLTLPAFTSMS